MVIVGIRCRQPSQDRFLLPPATGTKGFPIERRLIDVDLSQVPETTRNQASAGHRHRHDSVGDPKTPLSGTPRRQEPAEKRAFTHPGDGPGRGQCGSMRPPESWRHSFKTSPNPSGRRPAKPMLGTVVAAVRGCVPLLRTENSPGELAAGIPLRPACGRVRTPG